MTELRVEGPIVTVFSIDVERPSSPYDNQPWLTEEEEEELESRRIRGGFRQTERSCQSLPSRSFLHVCGASKSLTPKPRKRKIITSLLLREQMNHFVSLTFVACFYFLIVLLFFFSLTVLFYKKEREDSVSVMFCKDKTCRDAPITDPDEIQGWNKGSGENDYFNHRTDYFLQSQIRFLLFFSYIKEAFIFFNFVKNKQIWQWSFVLGICISSGKVVLVHS